jgi:hypothetical protein
MQMHICFDQCLHCHCKAKSVARLLLTCIFAHVRTVHCSEKWSPLRIAAGCRLHNTAVRAIKLGLVDPEQGGVREMVAARAAAASTAPWGAMDPEKEELATLAHARVCLRTEVAVRAVTSGWSATRHWLHHTTIRTAVHAVLSIAERLRRQAAPPEEGWAEASQANPLLLPQLPPELWFVIMRFFLRCDWPVLE